MLGHDDCQQLELALPELHSIWQQWQQKSSNGSKSAALDRWEKQQAEDLKQSSESAAENDLAEEALPLEQRARHFESKKRRSEGRPW